MSTVTARALRPLLNRWLGSFNEDGQAEGEGEGSPRVRGAVELGTIVEFSCEEGGKQLIGEIRSIKPGGGMCSVCHLDLHGTPVHSRVPTRLINQVLRPPSADFVPQWRGQSEWRGQSYACEDYDGAVPA